jgi:putative CocE/NonD family hydrolase
MRELYEVDAVPNALIPCGAYELAADLYVPRNAPPGPALVTLLPYHKDWNAGVAFWNSGRYFAARGYPSLLVDFRGTGGSSGSLRPPFDPDEADDGVRVVEWAAAQAWCDGSVGMWGASYGGIVAMRTATRRPAPLKAIVPVIAQVDPGRDFVNPRGARGMRLPLNWALLNLLLQLVPPLYFDEQGRWADVWHQRLEGAEPYLTDLVGLEPSDPVWRERAIDVEAIEVPTLCVTGWRDFVCDAMIEAYERIAAPKKLVAGPWTHVMPHESPDHAIDFLPVMLAWWDRWLRGISNGIEAEPAATIFTFGTQEWSTFETWPPADRPGLQLALSADGALGGDVAGTVSTVLDATVGIQAGVMADRPSFGPLDDQHADDLRTLTFTTPALLEQLEILGRPCLRLRLAEAPEQEIPLVARLADVDDDGRSNPITSGTVLLEGGAGVAEIALAATSYEVPVGNRLRVSLGTDDFPFLWPSPDAEPVTIVCEPAGDTSTLILPLAPGAGRLRIEPTPVQAELAPHFIEAPSQRIEVAREHLTDAARVTISTRATMRAPHSSARIAMKQTLSAEVEARNRSSACCHGEAGAEIETDAELIQISVNLVAMNGQVTANGSVIRNGIVYFERAWEPGCSAIA